MNTRTCLAWGLFAALFGGLVACGSEAPRSGSDVDHTPGPEAGEDAGASDGATDGSSEIDGGHADGGGDLDAGGDGGTVNETDGICTPGVVTSGVYDPDCVYVYGTLLPGSAGWGVLMHPSAPAAYAHGFGNHFGAPVIRPVDGRLLFRTFSDLYLFTPDAVKVGSPTDVVLANDDPVPAPRCPVGAVRGFVFPDDSKTAYQCFQSVDHPDLAQHLFVEGQNAPLASGGAGVFPIAVGAGRSALFRNGSSRALSVFDGKTMRPVADAGAHVETPAVRFRGGAFLVAAVRAYGPDTIELLRVALDGSVTVLGTYQLGVPDTVYHECVLGPDGALFCFTGQLALADKVTRFSIGAPPQTVYDPVGPGKPVQLHISYLVTGP